MKNTARNLLETLHAIEARIWIENYTLHYKSPVAIPPDMLESLRRNRRDVIKLLRYMPTFTVNKNALCVTGICQQPLERQSAIRRMAVALRRDRQWPIYVADFVAIKEHMRQCNILFSGVTSE